MVQISVLVTDWLTDAGKHFIVAFMLGLLASLWTQTILFAPYSLVCLLRRRPLSTAVGYIILTCSLLLGFALALTSHYALDYFATWWSKPLGPPLELVPNL